MRTFYHILTFTFGLLALPNLIARDMDSLWNEANSAYIENRFADAADQYETIRELGYESSKLYLNLGNAYFKQHKNGQAILNYNRALRLAPNDDDVRYNLAIANTFVQDRIDVLPVFFLKRWMTTLRVSTTANGWAVYSILFFALILSSVLLYLLSDQLKWRKAGFYAGCGFIVLFLFSFIFGLKQRQDALHPDSAVIMTDAIPVNSSPDPGSTELFVLHEGTKVRIVDALGDYCEILLSDGNKGWVLSTALEKID